MEDLFLAEFVKRRIVEKELNVKKARITTLDRAWAMERHQIRKMKLELETEHKKFQATEHRLNETETRLEAEETGR